MQTVVKMKIGVIHWTYPPVAGGVERHLITVLPEITKKGWEVYLLTGTNAQDSVKSVRNFFIRSSVNLIPSEIKHKKANGCDLYSLAYNEFLDFIRLSRIDVIYAHNLHLNFPEYSQALWDVCYKFGLPLILVIHNDYFSSGDPIDSSTIVSKIKWNSILCMSNYLKKSILRKYPQISKKMISYIRHGVDLNLFRPFSNKEKETLKVNYKISGKGIIIHPGRMLPFKGIKESVMSMPDVIKDFPNAKLLLVNSPVISVDDRNRQRYVEDLMKTIQKNRLENNIKIFQNIDMQNDIPKLTGSSDILIYPSVIRKEPFGLCPVEAMACGVPTIVTNSGGLIESVIYDQTGFIVSSDQKKVSKELSEKILTLLSNQDLRNVMGKNGRRRAEKYFSAARVAQDFINLSESILNGE